jgi:hypothetical protein
LRILRPQIGRRWPEAGMDKSGNYFCAGPDMVDTCQEKKPPRIPLF